MHCKKCGREIKGEVQRYCSSCRKELNNKNNKDEEASKRKEALGNKQLKKQEKQNQKVSKKVEKQEMKRAKKKAKKEHKLENPRVWSLKYFFFIIFSIGITFVASWFVGFSIGPNLPF